MINERCYISTIAISRHFHCSELRISRRIPNLRSTLFRRRRVCEFSKNVCYHA